MTPEQLYRQTILDGGATVWTSDLSTDGVPNTGYAVGNGGYGSEVRVGDVVGFTEAVALLQLGNVAAWLGTWLSDGVIYVDPVSIISDLQSALRVARASNEQAIYDIDNGMDITVDY